MAYISTKTNDSHLQTEGTQSASEQDLVLSSCCLLCTKIHGLCSHLGFWHLALTMPNLTPGSSTLSFLIDGFEWGTVKYNWVSSQFQLKTKQNENEPLQNPAFQKSSEIKHKSPIKKEFKKTHNPSNLTPPSACDPNNAGWGKTKLPLSLSKLYDVLKTQRSQQNFWFWNPFSSHEPCVRQLLWCKQEKWTRNTARFTYQETFSS